MWLTLTSYSLILIAFVFVIVRGLILYPIAALMNGWKAALPNYLYSVVLIIPLLIYELGNLTGFSWTRLKYVSKDEIVDSAIRHSYPNIYSNLKDLQHDYSKFKPEVRYWGSWSWQVENGLIAKLFGLTRYQVRLPEEIVIVNVDGKADFSRSDTGCSGDGGCPLTPPDNTEQGIVGTVQLGGPNYEVSKDFSVEWDGEVKDDMTTWGKKNGGDIFISNHCFSAYIKSSRLNRLVVSPKEANPTSIRQGYGFYLVAITSDAYSAMRISKAEFLKSKSCNKEVREAWPNIGGWAWKR
ncbi:MAG TPA: hypothetical protein VK974_05035 [Methylophilaceae bacterium]|nr:hypothetical protein [Methylophilaceae bacterium]